MNPTPTQAILKKIGAWFTHARLVAQPRLPICLASSGTLPNYRLA
jgi:hypothetical protein